MINVAGRPPKNLDSKMKLLAILALAGLMLLIHWWTHRDHDNHM